MTNIRVPQEAGAAFLTPSKDSGAHPLHPQALVLRLQGAVALLQRLYCRAQCVVSRGSKVQSSAIAQPQLRPARRAGVKGSNNGLRSCKAGGAAGECCDT